MSEVLLLIGVALPVVLLLLFRANAAIVFLSLCAGSILAKYTGDTAVLASTSFVTNHRDIVESATRIGVLLAPAIITVLLQRKSVSGGKLVINILSSLAVGVVGVLLIVPLLPFASQNAATATHAWSLLTSFQDAVVAGGVFLSLLVLWVSKPKRDHGKSKKH